MPLGKMLGTSAGSSHGTGEKVVRKQNILELMTKLWMDNKGEEIQVDLYVTCMIERMVVSLENGDLWITVNYCNYFQSSKTKEND